MKLNLGCNDRHLPGYINVDRLPPADEIADLSKPWPWPDSSVDHIVAHDIIEHLLDKIHTMNELHRVLKPGASVDIAVPTTDGPGAFQDPTHISYWNANSFLYYEDGELCRERFGSHYGITARFRTTRKVLTPTGDGPRLTITLSAVKAPLAPKPEVSQDIVQRLVGCEVLGAMRIKNEARWIQASIESQLSICDKVLVLDDHSTDDTRAIVGSFGDRCVLIESPFEGLQEIRDKNYLLEYLVAASPAWVVWIDGDEVLEKTAAQVLRREFLVQETAGLALQVLYFWDSTDQYRVDGIYGSFSRVSCFRVRGQTGLRFAGIHAAAGSGDGALHCGNAPQGFQGTLHHSAVRIKHYGYLTQTERQAKYEYYNQQDPNNEAEDCYRHIVEIPGARWAPGPTVLKRWEE